MDAADPQTKRCPFCAETIQAPAVKCRYCGEFLNTNKAKALRSGTEPDSQSPHEETKKPATRFRARPSLFGMAGMVVRGIFFLAIAAFLILYPVENSSLFQFDAGEHLAAYNELIESVLTSGLSDQLRSEMEAYGINPDLDTYSYNELVESLPELELTDDLNQRLSRSGLLESLQQKDFKFSLTAEQTLAIARYRFMAGLALAVFVLFVFLFRALQLKTTCYVVSADRIEWSRGIFDRKIDNLDMFRVVDLKMRRTLLDCIFGIGTVTLITTDKTDPKFTFRKVRDCRRLYDIIKQASLSADQKRGVIHLE